MAERTKTSPDEPSPEETSHEEGGDTASNSIVEEGTAINPATKCDSPTDGAPSLGPDSFPDSFPDAAPSLIPEFSSDTGAAAGPLRSRILKSGGAIGLFTVFQYAAAIGSQMILARLLGPEDFGNYAFVLLIHGLFSNLRNIHGGQFLIAHKGENFDRVYSTVFTADLTLSTIATALSIVFAAPIMGLAGRRDLATEFAWMAPAFVFMALSLPTVIFSKRIDFIRSNVPGMFGILIGPCAKIAMALSGFGIMSLIWGEMIRQAVVAILTFAICPAWPRLVWDRSIIWDAFKFGAPITITGLIVYYYWKVDDYLVGVFLGAKDLGYYFLAFRIPEYFFNLKIAVAPLVFASLCAVESDEKQREGFVILTHLTAVATALPVVVSMLFGQELITRVFGNQWLPSVPAFQILMTTTAARMAFGYMADILTAKKMTWWLPLLTIQNAVVLTVSAIYLTPRYGISGTAASVLITVLASLLVTVPLCQYLLGLNPIHLVMRPVLCAAVTWGVGRFLGSHQTVSEVAILGHGTLICVTYYLLVMALDPLALREIYRVTHWKLPGYRARYRATSAPASAATPGAPPDSTPGAG